uniref:Secreted protein n=1 Tax=Mesocestoides corti TaxID=53468 RepID=A0A5K3EJT3_MESCO
MFTRIALRQCFLTGCGECRGTNPLLCLFKHALVIDAFAVWSFFRRSRATQSVTLTFECIQTRALLSLPRRNFLHLAPTWPRK